MNKDPISIYFYIQKKREVGLKPRTSRVFLLPVVTQFSTTSRKSRRGVRGRVLVRSCEPGRPSLFGTSGLGGTTCFTDCLPSRVDPDEDVSQSFRVCPRSFGILLSITPPRPRTPPVSRDTCFRHRNFGSTYGSGQITPSS